jgi:hypothetical protein
MNRTLYSFGIVLLGISLLINVTQSILVLLVDGSLYTFSGFDNWFLLSSLIGFASALVLLKYFWFKQFYFPFWAALFSLLVNVGMQFLFYQMLSGRRDLMPAYMSTVFVLVVAALVYSLSLISPGASRQIWLKRGGVFLLPISLVLLILTAINVLSDDVVLKVNAQKWLGLVALFPSIFPLFLLFNFREELRHEAIGSQPVEGVRTLTGGLALVAFSFMLVFGVTLVWDARTYLYWQGKNSEATTKFVSMGEERVFENDRGEKLRYLLIKPVNYNPNTKYPLLVSLPYRGYEASAAQLLAEGSNPYKYPAFLFVPFCPEGAGWGGIANYPTIDTLVFEAIIDLEKVMNIDGSRRYVTGVSRGGYGSWHFITSRPDMFAAAIPVCGAGNTKFAPRAVDVAVWAFHGALDRNVPVAGSRDMINAIKKSGGNPKYTEFEEKAHNIWYEVAQTPGIWDWLFEQKKSMNSNH